ncbi:MAG: nicotinate-nicotinamide nucleotide adenylyltransferase [Candidatus Poribacteria bacterium]|nr:nicotinate-nicotinamide nucleotide adenylyltransferase [Candidatus Poribacteria bacterium]
MAETLLNLLTQECKRHPDYEWFVELFKGLDPSAPPQIDFIHRAALPSRETKKLGIFSGSFNPLTLAHVRMIEDTLTKYQLDEVLLLLAKANVDKDIFGLPLAARLVTLKKYAIDHQRFSVGVSSHGRYIDKVIALKAIFPSETEFHFIVGYDTLVRIFDPKYYTNFHAELQELFISARFIVANRAAAGIKTIESFMTQPEIRRYTSYVSSLLLPDTYAYMSSTEARELLARDEAIKHLVPSSILAMLDRNPSKAIHKE